MASAYACWRGARRPGRVRSTVALWYPLSSVFLERMSGVCMTVLWLVWVGSNEYTYRRVIMSGITYHARGPRAALSGRAHGRRRSQGPAARF